MTSPLSSISQFGNIEIVPFRGYVSVRRNSFRIMSSWATHNDQVEVLISDYAKGHLRSLMVSMFVTLTFQGHH